MNVDGILDLLVTAGTEFSNLFLDYSPDVELIDNISDPNQLYLNTFDEGFPFILSLFIVITTYRLFRDNIINNCNNISVNNYDNG